MSRLAPALLLLALAATVAEAGEDAALLLLRGRPEAMEASPEERDPDALLPLGVRDLWWRPDARADRGRFEPFAEEASLTGRRWRWLLAGGEGTHPVPDAGEPEPDPVLAALVGDRILRDRRGHAEVLGASPLRSLEGDPAVGEEVRWFLKEVMAWSYGGPAPRSDPAAAERHGRARSRNRLAALVAVLLFVGLSAGAAFVLRPRPAPGR